jgi:kumamolisin
MNPHQTKKENDCLRLRPNDFEPKLRNNCVMRITRATLALGLVLACGDNRVAGSDDAAAIDSAPIDARPIDAMVDVPPDQVPTEVIDGLPNPSAVIYEDLGEAALDARFRALLGFPLRDEAALDTSVRDIYTPSNARFRQYMSKDEWMTSHAPLQDDIDRVVAYLVANGFAVPRIAGNRLLLEFNGTVGQFQTAFGPRLHLLQKIVGHDGQVYGTAEKLTVPKFVADRISAILTADLLPETGTLLGEAGQVTTTPPPNALTAQSPARLATSYGTEAMMASGNRGAGETIGIVVGATFKFKDLQSFWQGFGITRSDPTVVKVVPGTITRFLETTIDIQWAGAMAPQAGLIVYEGPDIRESSLLYVYNEAVARNQVTVLTTSFAHRETSVSAAERKMYEKITKQAAAFGITCVAASGNSKDVDVPGSSPYVTAVGGTVLRSDSSGNRTSEQAWALAGAGESLTITKPAWQSAIITVANRRATVDVALNAGTAYWTYYLGDWTNGWAGTSFAAPTMAGMIAVTNSYRRGLGKLRLGWLNQVLYTTPAAQRTFFDVVDGTASDFPAAVGWDFASGWGAPSMQALGDAMP